MPPDLDLQQRDLDDLTEVRFRLPSGGETVPGAFFYPPDADTPLPLVLIQHPLTSSKDDYFVRDIGMLWARHGWMVGGIDAPLHGERDSYDPLSLLRDADRLPAIATRFGEEIAAVIELLAGRYAIDRSRLGYVGYSAGSMLGIPAVAAHGGFRAAAFCLIGEGRMVGTAADPESPVHQLGGVAVRIVGKTQDEYFPRAATEALFNAIPGSDKDLVWIPGGHFDIGPDVIRAAEQWLKAKL
jgi:dienelactone hydrolase